MTWKHTYAVLMAAALATGVGIDIDAQQPPPPGGASKQDHVAALKQSLQEGQKRIRAYEWVETTIISLKGEEKARKQNRCFYGADGKVQKVAIGEPAPQQADSGGGGGRRRGGGKVKEKVVENKKDEMQEYMKNAAALIHKYVPPAPAQIQAAKDAGRITVTPEAGGAVRLAIAQYLQPGDTMTIDLDAAADRLKGLGVKTYLDKPDEPVTLDVQMATLPDGALYAAQTTLDASAKKIRVVIQNSGYRPLSK